ncbi:MAG: type I restriction-modification enzyme R subunit C-terminal domain-containing protein [Pirellulales bacterium]
MGLKPEDQARKEIDRQLDACGWIVQDYADRDITAAVGVAVREFPLESGFADYLLYADGQVIGVVEAKQVGHPLRGVEGQADKYAKGLPAGIPRYHDPVPFAYVTTGKETLCTNLLDPEPRSREVFSFHRPEELIRLAGLGRDEQLRTLLQKFPPLDLAKLWKVQHQAITNLEKSLAENRPRSLIQMATGSGKTFTAVNFCYRLIKHAKAKRILFLVDRNNLGKQTLSEFQQFINPANGYKFTEEYTVQHLKRNTIDPAAKVCITTIQRLYSMLQGEAEYLEEYEESSQFEHDQPLHKEPLPVAYNPRIPIETFDFVVVDECHRSIYNLWRQVLDYFDAFLIGLTATPTEQTFGFFNRNLVQEYTHEKAVADGVNVGFDVFRIETQITRDGAKLVKKPHEFVPHRDRRTRVRRFRELDEDVAYEGTQLDRDVVNKDQIRLVIKTFRDNLKSIFPHRTEVPKTLVFAKTDSHAEDLVEIIREEFGRGNDFCQKITSKTTHKKPDDLLADFRNAFNPRIAVTVDMIATGTDVKPLECLLFMRNIRSLSYFEQMKGRGCRVIDPDRLQSVTPDATSKTHFVIVDAVGVCEQEKAATKPLDRKPSIPLEKLLHEVANGVASADLASTLAARFARLERQLDDQQREDIEQRLGGKSLGDFSIELLDAIDPDAVNQEALDKHQLPPDATPTDEQLDAIERERVRQALKPLHNPKLRDAILGLKGELEQVEDEVNKDTLIGAGFDVKAKERAQTIISSFRGFIEEHKESIEALQILYSRPHRAGLRYSQIKQLANAIERPPYGLSLVRVWQAFELVEPKKVKGGGGKAIVDIVALVKHALDPAGELIPIVATVHERYDAWLADQQARGVKFSGEQLRWLEAIRDHIAASLAVERDDLDEVPFSQYGGLGRAHELFGDQLTAILEELNGRLAA